ncbi:MAG: NEW3 domain-containing protein [Bacteroidota bacterium]
MRSFLLSLILLLVTGFQGNLIAQTGTYFNPRDDQFKLLGLKRGLDAYNIAKADFERQKELFEKGLSSRADLERAERTYRDAEVNYQQAFLAVIYERRYISIEKAIKFQRPDGTRRVKLTLANLTSGTSDIKRLLNIEEGLYALVQPDVINDVYVSVMNDQGAIISQPYEIKIEALKVGEPPTIEFNLLQDVDVATVRLIFAQNQDQKKIYFQKDATANRVAFVTEQFSQEAPLASTATFRMRMELFSSAQNTFRLEVVNLPLQLNTYFQDPQTQARITQLKYTEGVNTKNVSLNVLLPTRANEELKIDQPIKFYVLAIPQSSDIRSDRSKTMTDEQVRRLNVGYTQLELVPRGIGQFMIRAQQLYYEINPGQTVAMTLDIVNEGSRWLDNVRIDADMPLNWTKVIEPNTINRLDPTAEQRVSFTFKPPPEVGVGKYDIRIRVGGRSDNQPLEAEPRTATIQVIPTANVLGTAAIVVLIIGLVVGIVVFGIRLAKR